jgi:glycosyltransferase involved in cell wall biosynthesis
VQSESDHFCFPEHCQRCDTKFWGIECDRITVVPNAVESIFQCLLQQERDLFRQQHQISRETTCLLNVGSNHPRKNILTILKVLLNLKNRQLPVHFWKTGADFNDEQKYLSRPQLRRFITYLGQPDKQTLVQIYNAADILLAPSIQEGFGMTILEAMACGTPVITSNMSAMPEVAGDAVS